MRDKLQLLLKHESIFIVVVETPLIGSRQITAASTTKDVKEYIRKPQLSGVND